VTNPVTFLIKKRMISGIRNTNFYLMISPLQLGNLIPKSEVVLKCLWREGKLKCQNPKGMDSGIRHSKTVPKIHFLKKKGE
jgi:hypothetical protein